MAIPETANSKSFGEKLLSVPRWVLFLVLFFMASWPLFKPVPIPNQPSDSSADLFRELMQLPEGSTVIIQSDWTNSTRGESRGQFDALLRILMRRNIKFGLMAVADTQAPEVARDVIELINLERRQASPPQREYKRWEDWVNLGYFPNAEGTGNQLAQSLRDTFGNRRDKDPSGSEQRVLESPVFQGIDDVGKLSAFIVVTGTKSIVIAIERLQAKVKILGMVTGVMGPETLNYYVSGQLKGLSAGLKGVYDMETMMDKGVNVPGPDGKPVYTTQKFNEPIQGFSGEKNLDKGTRYIFTLHMAILLLILVVVIGNVGVILTRTKVKA